MRTNLIFPPLPLLFHVFTVGIFFQWPLEKKGSIFSRLSLREKNKHTQPLFHFTAYLEKGIRPVSERRCISQIWTKKTPPIGHRSNGHVKEIKGNRQKKEPATNVDLHYRIWRTKVCDQVKEFPIGATRSIVWQATPTISLTLCVFFRRRISQKIKEEKNKAFRSISRHDRALVTSLSTMDPDTRLMFALLKHPPPPEPRSRVHRISNSNISWTNEYSVSPNMVVE